MKEFIEGILARQKQFAENFRTRIPPGSKVQYQRSIGITIGGKGIYGTGFLDQNTVYVRNVDGKPEKEDKWPADKVKLKG